MKTFSKYISDLKYIFKSFFLTLVRFTRNTISKNRNRSDCPSSWLNDFVNDNIVSLDNHRKRDVMSKETFLSIVTYNLTFRGPLRLPTKPRTSYFLPSLGWPYTPITLETFPLPRIPRPSPSSARVEGRWRCLCYLKVYAPPTHHGHIRPVVQTTGVSVPIPQPSVREPVTSPWTSRHRRSDHVFTDGVSPLYPLRRLSWLRGLPRPSSGMRGTVKVGFSSPPFDFILTIICRLKRLTTEPRSKLTWISSLNRSESETQSRQICQYNYVYLVFSSGTNQRLSAKNFIWKNSKGPLGSIVLISVNLDE